MRSVNEAPQPGELAPSGIDAGPRARTIGLVVLAGWLLLHVSLPLSYYVSDDIYDERFAWRMFSAVRVQECTLGAQETVGGIARPIPMSSVLPAPWIALLQRNRPAVIHRFLDWRCRSEAQPSEVTLTHTCRSVTGDMLPAHHRSLDCASHTFEESTDE
jgi:hypothetical protein